MPRRSASLENFPECDLQVASLIDEIWGVQTDEKMPLVRNMGKGKVISGMSLEEGMQEIGKLPDFTYKSIGGDPRPDLRWYQRNTENAKYWFVCNHGYTKSGVQASFEVSGLQPEWWDPVDGSFRELSDFKMEEGHTIVPLTFEPLQSGFVVFRREMEQESRQKELNFPEMKPVMEVQGPWRISFDPRWGGPDDQLTFEHLSDWSKHDAPGIRYYSGTAVYQKILDVPSSVRNSSTTVFLDLGKVHNLAQVKLNGKDLGTVWCAPWRVTVPAGLLKKKGNELEITVVNTWVNRLIGDEFEPDDFETEPGNQEGTRLGSYDIKVKSRGLKELPAWLIDNEPRPSSGRYTFTSWFYYNKEAPLQPAGLLGPVQLLTAE